MLDFQQKKQLSILVKIAVVDEDFAEQEKDVIRKISEKYGATEKELQEIFDSPDYSEGLAPMSVVDKMDFMMDCMLVVLADEMVTSSEEYFARQMASKLGFDQGVVAFLVSHKDSSRDEMREQMLPFMTN